MIMAVAIERFVAVHNPLEHKRHSRNRLLKYAASVALVSIILNVGAFLEFDYDTELKHSEMYNDPAYLKYDCLIRSVIALGLIPFFTLTFLYTKIYQKITKSNVNQSEHRSNKKLSKICAGFVVTFIVCHTPRLIINVYFLLNSRMKEECSIGRPNWLPTWGIYMQCVQEVLVILNSAVNVLLYTCLSSQFRNECANVFCKSLSCVSKNTLGNAPPSTTPHPKYVSQLSNLSSSSQYYSVTEESPDLAMQLSYCLWPKRGERVDYPEDCGIQMTEGALYKPA